MNNYPEYAEINDKKYKINTDFRVAIECQNIATDESISDYERALAIIYKLFGDVGIDDFIRSNLSTTFYLNKLVDLYKNDVGVLGSIKKAFSHPFQTLLQKGVKDGVKFIDKKNIISIEVLL